MKKRTRKVMEIARSDEMRKAYASLLGELKCKPCKVAQKLRQRTWGRKSADEILTCAE